jgi:hypothetical protein
MRVPDIMLATYRVGQTEPSLGRGPDDGHEGNEDGADRTAGQSGRA